MKTPNQPKSVAVLFLATLLFTIAGLLPTVASAVEQTAPTVLNISSSVPDGSYRAGATIPVNVTFSTPVTVTGLPLLQLNSGVSTAAVYAGGSGTAVLTFNYTVGSGDSSALLDYSSSTALSANGGTIQDFTTSADAILTLPSPGAAGSLSANNSLTIDTTSPVVVSIVRQDPDDAVINDTTAIYRVTFSEAVVGVSINAFQLTSTGTATGTLAFVSSNSGSVIDLTVNAITGDGTLRLDLNASGTGITDPAGNSINGGFTAGDSYTIDNTPPTTTISSPSVALTRGGPVSYLVSYFDVNFNSSTLAPADITLNQTGTATALITVSGTGNSRTVTLSNITGDGTLGISVLGGTATDVVDNPATGAGPSATFTVDNTAPSVSSINLLAPVGPVVNSSSVTFRVVFSESVTSVTPGAFQLTPTGTATGAVASISSGSGTVVDVTISGVSGDGSLRLDLKGSGTGITDLAGNAISAGFSTGQSYTIDNTAPSISVGGPSLAITKGGPVTYSVTYNDVNFNSSTLTPVNVTLNKTGSANASVAVNGSGTTWSVTLSGITGDGTLGMSIAAGTATDLAGNSAPAAGPSGTFIVDNTAPNISIAGPSTSLTIGGPVTYTVTYADANFNSSTLSPSDVSLNTTGSASAAVGISGTGTSRLVTLSGITGNGTIGISLAAGTATDTAGNSAPAAGPSATFTVDNTGPTVVSITRLTPATPVVNSTSLSYHVTFSETVTGVTAGAFQLNLTGTAAGTIASVSPGSGTSVNVTINGVSGDGSLRLDLKASGTGITDTAGNAITGGFSTGDVYTIDNTAPVATIGGPSLSITRGGPVTFGVNYSDANFGSSTLATGNITLNRTGSANASVGVSGSGTAWLVTLSGITGDGTLGISIGAGTAVDAAGNSAPAAGPSTTFTVDNTTPTISVSAPSATLTIGGPVMYTVTYADLNFNSSTLGVGDVTVNKTGTANATVGISGTGLVRTVTLSGITGDGTLGISIGAGTATDTAGNFAPAAGPSATFAVDNTAPTVVSINRLTPSPTVVNATSLIYRVTFSESVTGVTTGAFQLSTTGTVLGAITSVSTASGSTVDVTITGVSGDGTLRLDLNSSGTGIADVAGNAISGGFTAGQTYTIDNTAPSISIGSPSVSITRGGPVTYAVTYADANFAGSTLTAGNVTLNTTGTANASVAVGGSGALRTVTLSGISGDGTLGISISGGTATDLAGNAAPAAGPSGTFTVDNTSVAVSVSSPSTSVTTSGPVNYTVTYSDANFGSSTLGVGDVTLNKTGSANAQVGVSGSGNTRAVTLSNITGDGSLGISIGAGTATDTAGNSAPATGPGATFTVDNTAPTITVGAPSATITIGGPVSYTVTYVDTNFSNSTLSMSDITLNTTGTANAMIGVTGSGTNWLVTLSSITGDGTLGISIAPGTATDTAGTPAMPAGPSATFTVDNTAPTVVSITRLNPIAASVNASVLTFEVTFSEPVTGVTTGAFQLTSTGTAAGTIASATSADGTVFDVTVSGVSGDGMLRLDLNGSGTGITDVAGNAIVGGFTTGQNYTIDNTPPMISIGAPSLSITRGGPVSYPVTYADVNFNSSTLMPGNIMLNRTGNANATVGVSGSGTSWTVTLSGISGDGSLGISIAAGTATDAAGNRAGAAGPSGTFTVDNTAPTITISGPSASLTIGGPVTYTVTYADVNFNSSTLSTANISLNATGTAGAVVGVSGTGTVRTVALTGITGDGTLGISIGAGTATDTAGNSAPAAGPSTTFTVDNTAPTVVSINRLNPAAPVVRATSLTYHVTFSETLTGVTAGAFQLTQTGTAIGTIASVSSSSGLSVDVTVSGVTGDGTLRLDLKSTGTGITDVAGNAINGGFTTGQAYTIDNTPPAVAIGAPSTSITAGGPVTYSVTYTDANFGSSTLSAGNIILNTTGTANAMIGVSGTGTTWTVTLSSITGDGSLGISIPAGTAMDAAGNNAPAAGPSGIFTVDNTAPTISLSGPSTPLTIGGPVTYTVTYADLNFSSSTLAPGDISLNSTGTASAVVGVSGSGTTRTVTLSGITGDGTLGISIAPGTATDTAGNRAPAAGPGTTFTVDNTPPTVVSISRLTPLASVVKTSTLVYRVTFSENVTGVGIGAFQLSTTGTAVGTIASVSSSSGSTVDVTINAASGSGTLRLDLKASGTGITDLAGNAINGGFTGGDTYTFDSTAPMVSISGPSTTITSGGPVTYTVSYSDPNFNSSTLAPTDIILIKNGNVNALVGVSGTGTTRTVTLSNITGDGSLAIGIPPGTATDSAGNGAPAAGPSPAFIVDNTAPTIVIGSPSSPITIAGPITYALTYIDTNFNFSTLSPEDITLNTTGTASASFDVSGSGTNWTVTLSNIAGDGTVGISVAGGTATDNAGNLAAPAGPSTSFIVDNTAPFVTAINFLNPAAPVINSTSVTYRVTFSELVTGVTTGAFQLTATGTAAGTIGSISAGSGTTIDVTVNGVSGDGTLRLDLNNGETGITDVAGNAINGGFSTGDTYTIDNTAPSVAIGTPSLSITRGGPVSYAVTYADANFGSILLGTGDITVNKTGTANATVAVSGSGTSWTVTLSGITGDGSLGISIRAGTATDLAGNSAPAAGPSATFTVDNTAPTISVSAPSTTLTIGGPVTYTVTYADVNFNSSTLSPVDVTLNTTGSAAAVVGVTGSGMTRTVTLSSITGDGTLGISIAAGTASDLAGNTAPSAGPSATFTVDNTAATVVSINRSTPATTVVNATSLTWHVTFSESVTGVSTGAFQLTATGTATGTIASVSASSGTAMNVTVNGVSGDGTLRLDLNNSGTGIADVAGNPINGGFTAGQSYTIDNTMPTLTIGAPSLPITASAPVTYSVTYADANFGSSTLSNGNITLNKTGTANATVAVSGSGATWTVTLSGITGDGTLGISIASGTATDLAGNPAPAAGPSGTVTVDNIAPTINVSGPSSPLTIGGPVTYAVTYTDVNFNSSTLSPSNISLNSTGTAGATVGVSGSGTSWTVTLSGITGDGTLGISIAAGTATDNAGNSAPATGPSGTFTVDNTAPTVVSISRLTPVAPVVNVSSVIYRVAFSENVTGISTGAFQLSATGTATGNIASISASTGSIADVTVTGVSGDGSLRLDLNGSGTGITDAAGNAINGGFTSGQPYTIDNTVPSILIGTPSLSVTRNGPISYAVTYADANFATSTLAAGNITLNTTGTAKANVSVSGSGTSWTVTLSGITGDGTLGISIAAGTAMDAAGNLAPAAGPSGTFTVDNTSIAVSISSPSSSITTGGPVTYTVTYTDANFGSSTLGVGDLTLNKAGSANATLAVSGTGNTRVVTLSNITGDGSLGISIAAGTATDTAGNSAPATGPSATFTVDNTAPTIIIGAPSAAITIGGPISYALTYVDTNFNFSTLSVPNITLNATGTATATVDVTGSGTNWIVNLSNIAGDGTLGISIAAGTATDMAGNPAGAAGPSTIFTVDNTAPIVASINRLNPLAAVVNSTAVVYEITFSENVNGVTTGAFQLTATGTAAGTIGSVASVNGAVYDVTVNGVSGDGTLRLDLNGSDTGISDVAGNAINGGFAAGQSYIIDNTSPTISIGTPSVSFARGGPVSYAVSYGDANFNASTLGTGDIILNKTGSANATVAVSGSGASKIVTLTGITGDGSLGISIGAGTATDLAGNSAPAAGPSATFTVDNTAPTISISAPSATLTISGPVTYLVTYADVNFNSSTLSPADVTLNTTGSAAAVVSVTGSGTARTVTLSGITGDGTLGISIAAGTASDLAGNTAPSAGPSATFTVDNTAATVVSINRLTPATSVVNATSLTWHVVFSESVTGVSTGAFQLTATGTATGTIASVSASSGTAMNVTVNGVSGDGTLRLDLNNSGTGITDVAGNPINGGFTAGQSYTIDNTMPTLTIGAPSLPITAGAPVTYAVTYADANFGSSTLSNGNITLNQTGTANATVAVSGSGTVWTVTLSGITGDGTLGISIAPGTATDLAGNPAPAAGPGGIFTVDNTAPTISVSGPSATISAQGPVTYTVTYSDANFGSSTLGLGDIALNTTGNSIASVAVSGSGTTRTVTLSNISGNGTLGISIAAGTATDTAGNRAPAAGPSTTFTVDNIPPTISIAGPSASLTAAGPVTYSVTYADVNFNSSSLSSGDVTLNKTGTANAAIAVSGTGSTRLVTLSGITGDGSLGISIAAGTATDTAGNSAPATGSSATFTVDNTAATVVSITRLTPETAVVNATNIVFRVSFSENVMGVSTNAFQLATVGTATGTVASVSTTQGTSVDVTITNVSGDGTLRLDVKSGGTGITDLAGNALTGGFTTGDIYTIDNTEPALTISAPSLPITAGGPVAYTVNYNDANFASATLSPADISLNATGTATATIGVSGTGTVWTVVLTGASGDGTLGISIGAGTATDLAGNAATTAGPSATFVVDNTAPTVTSIIRQTPTAALVNSSSVVYQVTFSEAVANVSTDDFTLTATGIATGTISSISANTGNVVNVTVTGISGDGTLRLDLNAGGTGIVDLAGNPISGGFTSGQAYSIDQTVPVITIGAPSVSLARGGPVAYTVSYSDLNFNTSTLSAADITLNRTGTATATVSVSGTGSTRLVTLSSITGDGTLGISVAAGTATDSAGNAAPASAPSTTFTVDNTGPTVLSVNRLIPGTTTVNSTVVSFRVTFSELVTGISTEAFQVASTGTASGAVASITGTSGSTVDVTVTGISGDGSLRLDLIGSGTGIADLAGNGVAGGFTSGQSYTIDNTAPMVIISAPSVNLARTGPVTYTVTYIDQNFGTSTLSAADITLSQAGSASASVSVSGSGATRTVTLSNITGDGTLGISIGAGTATDLAGNSARSTGVSATFTVDNTAPTVVSIIRMNPSDTVVDGSEAEFVVYRVVFSETVTGVSASAFQVNLTGTATGAIFAASPENGSTYDVTVTGLSGDGTIALGLIASGAGITDLAGNPIASDFTAGQGYTLDSIAPAINLSSPSASITQNGPVTYTVTYSDANFDSSTLTAAEVIVNSTGTAAATVNVSGTGLTRTVRLSNISGDGTLSISLLPDTATDLAGNSSLAAGPSAAFTVDNTAPTLTIGQPSTSTAASGPVTYTVSYADANFNTSTLSANDVTLNATGTATATVSVSGSGLTRTVTLSGISGDGSLGISIGTGTAIDMAGNLAPASGPSATFPVDNTPPILTISPPSVTLTGGGPVTYTVTYSDASFNTSTLGVGDITLNTTGSANATVDVSGAGLTRTVTLSGITGDGTLGISIAAGTATDVAGNPAPASPPSVTVKVVNTPIILGLKLLAPGSFSITISGAPNTTYTVQSNSNISRPDWEGVASVTTDAAGAGSTTFSDSSNSGFLFFRLALQ